MGSRPSSFVFTQQGPLRLYSTTELLNLPSPEWLVDTVITEGGLVGMFGAPENGKSFLAIDLALSVATGTPWQGHAVHQGFVLYISAEGGSGIGKRVRAWLQAHQLEPKQADVAWLIESIPVTADSESMEILMDRIGNEVQRHPVLVVIDTLARCFDGNENEQEDMGRFVAGADRLRQTFGATVMVVHHTNVGGTRERGNTAFRGAVDTMMKVEKVEQVLTLTCEKQKDAAHFPEHVLELVVVEAADSCVVKAAGDDAAATATTVLSLLGHTGLTWLQWRDQALAAGVVEDLVQFQKAFGSLRYYKQIQKHGDLWRITGSMED